MTEHHDLVRRYPDFDSLTRGYFYPDWRLHWSTVYEVYDAAFADFGEEGRRICAGKWSRSSTPTGRTGRCSGSSKRWTSRSTRNGGSD